MAEPDAALELQAAPAPPPRRALPETELHELVDRWFGTEIPGTPAAEHWTQLTEARDSLKKLISTAINGG